MRIVLKRNTFNKKVIPRHTVKRQVIPGKVIPMKTVIRTVNLRNTVRFYLADLSRHQAALSWLEALEPESRWLALGLDIHDQSVFLTLSGNT